MKISVFASSICYLINNGIYKNVYEAYKDLHACGVEGTELFDWVPLDEYKSILSETGISVSSLDIVFHSANESEKMIEKAAELKIPCVMLIPKAPFLADELLKTVEFAKKCGVFVTVENAGDLNIRSIEHLLSDVPGLLYTYDNGNFTLLGEDMLSAYERLEKHTVNVHIKDWRFDGSGKYSLPDGRRIDGAVLGDGFLPIREWLHRARDYKGYITIEMNTKEPLKNQIHFSIDFLKTNMEETNVS